MSQCERRSLSPSKNFIANRRFIGGKCNKQYGENQDRANVLLPLFLKNKGKNLVNWRKRFKKKDLTTNMRVRIIQAHEKVHHMLLLLYIKQGA